MVVVLFLYVLICIPIGIGTVILGLSGFSKAGFKLTMQRRITGRAGIIMGTVCVIVGLLLCWPLIFGLLGVLLRF